MIRRPYIILILCFVAALSARAENAPTAAERDSICLNEIQVENIDMYVDPSWNYGPWVEVFNLSSKEFDLQGCWVSDDPENLMKVHITQPHPLPAHGFVNLWFEHHDKYCLSQLALKLSTTGGTLYLSDPYGNLLHSLSYPTPIPRTSYARRSDGSDEWGTTATPTPAATNGELHFCTERAPAPKPSVTGRVFSSRVMMTVDIPEGCTLRYTTDGSTPTLTNGTTTRMGRFSFSESSIVRLRLFHPDMLPSQVVTQTYVHENFDIPLPVASVVTDPRHLYSAELGIFTRGVNGRAGLGQSTPCNWNMDWDRPMNFEFFDEQGRQVINQEAGMKRNGAYSRAYTPYGWKVNAEKQYEGVNRLSYQFFHHKPYLRHKQIVFRSAGSDYNCRLKDPSVHEIVLRSGLNVDAQAYEPVVHYLNGLYRGTINLREPNNKNYVYANYGYDSDEIDFFEMDGDSGYVQKCGDRQAWEQLYTLAKTASDPVAYAQIERLIDVDEICNYMAVELYMGNDDWPKNNLKGWRPLREDGRFRFILYDIDHAFGLSSPFTSFASKKTWTWNALYNEFNESIPRIKGEVEIVTIFLNLLQNSTFRRHFIDAFCIVAGSVFEPSRCQSIISEMCQRVEEIQQQPDNGYGRNASPWGTGNTMISNYQTRAEAMYKCLQDYAAMGLKGAAKTDVNLSSNTPRAQLFVNDQIVPTGAFSGRLYPPVTLRAEAPAGYDFQGWYLTEGSVNSVAETIFPAGDTWSYYDRGSLDNSPTWPQLSHNDSRWASGPAPLGFNKNNTSVTTVLDYGDNASAKRPTYYFRKRFSLSKAPTEDDVVRFSYWLDDGLILYVNGTEALRVNLPAEGVTYSTYAPSLASGNPDAATVTLPASLFRKGQNVIAAEVHNYSATSSDIFWDAQLTIRRPQSFPDGLISSQPETTLPEADEAIRLEARFVPSDAPASHVVINEVSAANSMYVNEYFKKADWIELYNPTSEPVDLSGMYLSDDLRRPTKYRIEGTASPESSVIPAYGHRIVWCDGVPGESQLHASFKLSNTDGSIVLLTASDGAWADTLVYRAHQGDESIGRFPDGTEKLYRMSRPTIDRSNTLTQLSEPYAPPTVPYVEPLTDVPTLMASRDGELSITPRHGMLIVHSAGETELTLQVFTLGGELVMQQQLQATGSHCEVDTRLLRPSTYVASVTTPDGQRCTAKFVR